MRLKLTLNRPVPAPPDDVLVDLDLDTPVGDLAHALIERDPMRGGVAIEQQRLTIRVDGPDGRILAPEDSVGEATLRSGEAVSVVGDPEGMVEGTDARAAPATLVIQEGPGAGSRFPLKRGANEVGRDPGCEVRLDDPMVSKHHVRVNVTDAVEVIDLGSANGIYVDGVLVQRVFVRAGDRFVLGDTVLTVEHHRASGAVQTGNVVAFNRSPYLDPVHPGTTLKAPEPPTPPRPQRFPFLVMAAPLILGVVMYALTRQLISVVFIALSPLLMVGSYFQQRATDKRSWAEAKAQYHDALEHLAATIDRLQAEEVEGRRHELPAAIEAQTVALRRGPLLWVRRPDRHSFLSLRAGIASLPTRVAVDLPQSNNTVPELWQALMDVVDQRRLVHGVPLEASLLDAGVVGVAGPGEFGAGSMRALLTQVVALHSPAEVCLVAMLTNEHGADWDWLKWLPHTDPAHSPLEVPSLGVGGNGATALAHALRDLIDLRLAGDEPAAGDADEGGRRAAANAKVVVLVDDEVQVERSLLIELAERGAGAGVTFLWLAPSLERLPARTEVYLSHDPTTGQAEAGIIDGGRRVVPVDTEVVSVADATQLARSLAPVVDAGAGLDDAGSMPSRVSFVDRLGLDLIDADADAAAAEVVARWRASDSLPSAGAPSRRKRAQPLHALVGATAHENMLLDLRAQGPHALVGGTTGAGKSEFLQSWVMGLAMNHSPARVTFLFVDYKGGAAFSECVRLPHTVGLVTDLTPHLVKRALRSLNAELRFREHILNRKRAKDVLELELRGDPECPPSLVIVVDEFAALVQEVPEFVDGVVNVAQRGRSLGLHLILATQRPAGVIRDNLRANTNLRVALRMADETDSDDVVGSTIAAGFDPALPGRAVAKTGPGRLHRFQTAYVGGWTTGEALPTQLAITELRVGAGATWEPPASDGEPDEVDPGPNDLHRLVESAIGAASSVGIGAPRKPWLPVLADVYDLARIPRTRVDAELTYGVADDPDQQRQLPVAFHPDADGNMAVIGTGGSGKSTFLRTIAVSAGASTRGGPCHVYGLDFGSRGLQMLEGLPHVGAIVNGDDDERVGRLLRMLRDTIDERAVRYAAVRAGTITEYRALADEPDEPRVLLLVDGFPAFRQDYEIGPRMRTYDRFQSIATDGRQVGVHVVVAADRPSAIPAALGSMIQRRLVLRLAGENDYVLAGVDPSALDDAPPGRGFTGGAEVQVSVLGGSPNTAEQASALHQLAADMAAAVPREPAPDIGRLPDVVHLGSLPPVANGTGASGGAGGPAGAGGSGAAGGASGGGATGGGAAGGGSAAGGAAGGGAAAGPSGASDAGGASGAAGAGAVGASGAGPSGGNGPGSVRAVIGVEDESLGPMVVDLGDPLFVIGPPRSGKTTTLVTLALALRRDHPDVELAYIGDGRSRLRDSVPFDHVVVTGPDSRDDLDALARTVREADGPGRLALFFEDAPALANLEIDPDLVTLFEVAARSGQVVVADGETSASLGSSWGLMKSVRVARHGIALVPDQFDGDAMYKTPFPPLNRRDYPAGRGIYVRNGRLARLQVALPDFDVA